MSTIVRAVVTNGAKQYWPQFFGSLLGVATGTSTAGNWNPFIRHFKIGRGGWVITASSPVRRQPDPSLTDLDIVSNTASRYSAVTGNVLWFKKNLLLADLSYVAPNIVNAACTLTVGEFNDIQGTATVPPGGSNLGPSGTNPDLYEIGLFSDHPTIGLGNNAGVIATPSTFTAAGAGFTAADVGKELEISGSGLGNNGTYIIATYISGTQVTIQTTFTANEAALTWKTRTYLMVAYGTFDKQTKTGGAPLTNNVRIVFG